jgi:hypothetical protein
MNKQSKQYIIHMHITHHFLFYFSLFRIQNENCGSGVGSTKKEKKKEKG